MHVIRVKLTPNCCMIWVSLGDFLSKRELKHQHGNQIVNFELSFKGWQLALTWKESLANSLQIKKKESVIGDRTRKLVNN